MDDEESVLGFTEERALITLGRIHTHPTQSCFTSSVDLHTFGIFRLTDLPGLRCTAKHAFHPHPAVPIYTDAHGVHVQSDAALESVDLR
ncbi:hypothetical protein DFH09DRAFT_1319967 [Mycena vulgaris]|nr:hypothetical protein DFH09DRAFT_1319967 [Mycena vulgaris]